MRDRRVVYGTNNGLLGRVILGNGDTETLHEFTLEDGKKSGVTCVAAADISESGTADIIVGREDGSACLPIVCAYA